MTRWPPLPVEVPGVNGLIRVRRVAAADLPGALGRYDNATRTIRIWRRLRREVAWQALVHEWEHAALDDCGVHLREQQEESVCQATAAAMMAVLRAHLEE